MRRVWLILFLVSCFFAGCDLYTWKEPAPDCDSGPCCRDGSWVTAGESCLSGTDSLDCTSDICSDDHTCDHPISKGFCLIDGTCYSHNQDNTEQSCQFCDSNVSQISWQNKLSSTTCDDEDFCTYNDRCNPDGLCKGTALACESESGICGLQRSCDGSDTCVESYPSSDTTCDDEDPCTYSDACDGAGNCQGVSITCTADPNPCAYQPYCDGSSQCATGYPGEATSCEDNDPCTYDDRCDGSGNCGGTALLCEDELSTCSVKRSCDGSDTCVEAYPGSETSCDDGDPCTRTDICDGVGQCKGVSYDCNSHGTCNSSDDICTCTDAAYAGDFCDQCASGYYELPVSSGICITDPCNSDPCHSHGSCDNSTGSAVCTCNDAFIGDLCDEELLRCRIGRLSRLLHTISHRLFDAALLFGSSDECIPLL